MRRVEPGLGGVPGGELPVRPEDVGGRRIEPVDEPAERARHLVRRGDGGRPLIGWARETRWSWPASSRRSARPIARSTSVEALIRRPCSSHVYQVTDTPASRATSSRRRPGVRRPRPRGSLTASGVSASRRARRNSASSARCWSSIGPVEHTAADVGASVGTGPYQPRAARRSSSAWQDGRPCLPRFRPRRRLHEALRRLRAPVAERGRRRAVPRRRGAAGLRRSRSQGLSTAYIDRARHRSGRRRSPSAASCSASTSPARRSWVC